MGRGPPPPPAPPPLDFGRPPAAMAFSLLYGLWQYLFSKQELRVLIVGPDGAGKTTLLERMKSLNTESEGLLPHQILPTVGLNIGRFEANNARLIFWDLGGAQSLRGIWEKYYDDAHALLFVIDGSDARRYAEARDTLHAALSNRSLNGAPVLVAANKSDVAALSGAAAPTDASAPSPGGAKAAAGHASADVMSALHDALWGPDGFLDGWTANRVHLHATCARDGTGVQHAVTWLVDAVRRSPRALRMAAHKAAEEEREAIARRAAAHRSGARVTR